MANSFETSPHYFCTYFDYHFSVRALTLYRSLKNNIDNFILVAVCLDERSFALINQLNISNIIPISLHEIEENDKSLLIAKNNRSLIEYYFTLSPIVPLYLLQKFPQIQAITYLDSDLFFYSSPEPILNQLATHSILIIPHRFPSTLLANEIYGIYNVGMITFKNDSIGRGCLTLWKQQCLAWCYDRVEDGKFADQKYLDAWDKQFSNVYIVQHKGAGLAPWNWMQYDIKLHPGRNIEIDQETLIFYHFHNVKFINENWMIPGYTLYSNHITAQLRHLLYYRYGSEIQLTLQLMRLKGINYQFSLTENRLNSSILEQITIAIKNRSLMHINNNMQHINLNSCERLLC